MNQQQLQNARAALWHQNASPLLTFDDAAAWLEETGFCLFLPRHAQLPAPAPSFVEACAGAARALPSNQEIEQAFALAVRLMGEGLAIPLNLLGTFSEQPDYLVTPEVLPWVTAVRGDRQWKAAPAGRTAPIVLRTWEALEREPDRTAAEIRETLGRELTEAAVMRALIELWSTLRVVPSYFPGEPTRWNLLKKKHPSELAAGANTNQTTAVSALVSLYLRSAVAATGEETEIFLSSLTGRSRIRDVAHGMTATRQLGTMSVGSETLLFVEGSLPEVQPAAEEGHGAERVPATSGPDLRANVGQERRRERGQGAKPEWKPRRERDQERPVFRRGEERPQERKQGRKPTFGSGPQREFAARGDRRQPRFDRGAGSGGRKSSNQPRPEWKPAKQGAGTPGKPREERPRGEFRSQRFENRRPEGRDRRAGGWKPPSRPPGQGRREGEERAGERPQGEKKFTRRDRDARDARGEGRPFNRGAEREGRGGREAGRPGNQDRDRFGNRSWRQGEPARESTGKEGERPGFAPKGRARPFRKGPPRGGRSEKSRFSASGEQRRSGKSEGRFAGKGFSQPSSKFTRSDRPNRGKGPGKPFSKRKSGPGEGKPRKNRNREQESPE